jgi:hypothetical protein
MNSCTYDDFSSDCLPSYYLSQTKKCSCDFTINSHNCGFYNDMYSTLKLYVVKDNNNQDIC